SRRRNRRARPASLRCRAGGRTERGCRAAAWWTRCGPSNLLDCSPLWIADSVGGEQASPARGQAISKTRPPNLENDHRRQPVEVVVEVRRALVDIAVVELDLAIVPLGEPGEAEGAGGETALLEAAERFDLVPAPDQLHAPRADVPRQEQAGLAVRSLQAPRREAVRRVVVAALHPGRLGRHRPAPGERLVVEHLRPPGVIGALLGREAGLVARVDAPVLRVHLPCDLENLLLAEGRAGGAERGLGREPVVRGAHRAAQAARGVGVLLVGA